MKTTGNTILVTGGGSGIGLALAQRWHDAGNKVIVTGRNAAKLDAAIAGRPNMSAVSLDVIDADAIAAFAKDVVAKHPGLNVLVNNAGIMSTEDASAKRDLAEAEATVITNILGPIRLTDAPRGRGRLATFPRHAYASTFKRLQCVAVVRKKGLSIRTQHTFLPTSIETSWVVRSATARRLKIDAILPSRWRQAKIDAVRHDGTRVPLVVHARPHGRIPLSQVAYFHVQSAKSGYVVVVRKAPARASAAAIDIVRRRSTG